MEANKLQVYYDGACPLCSREIRHYMRKDTQHRMDFVDIADPCFQAEREGLDTQKVQKEMHVRLPSGEIQTAVRAFAEIWKRIPGYEWMSRVVLWKGVYPFAYVGYQLFARGIRPYLPKRKRDGSTCPNGTCNR